MHILYTNRLYIYAEQYNHYRNNVLKCTVKILREKHQVAGGTGHNFYIVHWSIVLRVRSSEFQVISISSMDNTSISKSVILSK